MILRRIIEFLVYSNLFVAISAACASASTMVLLNSPINDTLKPALFVCFSTYFVYNFQRIWRMDHRQHTANDRLKWIYKNRKYIKWSLLLVTLPLIYYSSHFNLFELLILGICALISIGYVLPVIRHNSKWKMLRDIPYIKIFIVSLIWTIITVYLPFFMIHDEINDSLSTLNLLAIDRFAFIFAITLPFDIRDLKYDRKDQLKTIALRIGVKRTKVLSMAIISGLILLHIAAELNLSLLAQMMHFGIIIGYVLSSMVISLTNENRKELFYSGLIESLIILQLILILLFTSI